MPSHQLRRLRECLWTGELLDRGRQTLAKRTDAALSCMGYDFVKHAYLRRTGPQGRFFFAGESVDSILKLLRQRLPGRAEQIIQEAEEIRQHRFKLLGYSDLYYGHPIDWHLDAVHGKRAPKKAFYRLHYLEFAECGDSKVIWELNRHQHFVTLAKAYRLTHDRRYFDELLRQKSDWEAENPYPVGINWASSLEVALRSLSWIWTLGLLCDLAEAPALRSQWLPGLALHGRHVERYLSSYFSPNTHLLGEALALFSLGVLCPELTWAERWKQIGWEILVREAGRQVRSDGFYFEQSTYYHVYALDFFLHAFALASINNVPVPEEFREMIAKMSNALFMLSRSGPPPQFGDDDGGRLFDPRRNQSEHMLDPLSTAAVLFSRGDFKRLVREIREETLWLLGEAALRQWDALQEPEISRQSAALPEAGYYLLATPSSQLIADAGSLGAYSGGHGHADALSICLQTEGHSLLIDPGTSEYVGPGVARRLFRGTGMHNTIRIDGTDQAEIATVFSWRTFPRVIAEQWIQAPSCDLLVAAHDGYRRLQDPVTHRRWIVSMKNGTYLIRDFVDGSGRHSVDLSWHFGPDLQFADEHMFRVKGTTQTLNLLPARRAGWTEELDVEVCSPAYGRKARMTVLKFHADVVLPAEFAVLLVASEHAGGSSCRSFEWVDHSESPISDYRYQADGIEYEFMFNESGQAWRRGSVASDAKYVCRRSGPQISDELLFFCDGSHARTEELDLSGSRRVAWAELNVRDDVRAISCSDSSAISIRKTPAGRSDLAVLNTR